jgi:hypothetical protein
MGEKGLDLIIDKVQKEFDQAIIRINIAPTDFGDPSGEVGRHYVNNCSKKLNKTGIKLDVSHNFYSTTEYLNLLAKNTINCFFYQQVSGWVGISSAIDQAITVERPIAINNNVLFRHLFFLNDKMNIEYNSLKNIINNGVEHIKDLKHKWSEDVFVNRIEEILGTIL